MRLLLSACLVLSCIFAQGRKAVFEAASIKPTSTTNGNSTYNVDAGRVTATNRPLVDYIYIAYGVPPHLVLGATGWMKSDAYDIVAKLDDAGAEGLPGTDQPRARKDAEVDRAREAMQALLAERFHLKIHREQKMAPGFALTMAKGGIKATPNPSNDPPNMRYYANVLTAQRWSMQRMASFLTSTLQQPVVDATHLDGLYDVKLEFVLDEMAAARANPDGRPLPGIMAALQEQLGLKLESQRNPVEVIVVDSAERPTEN
jgi:uncharacterized protein (TIGR03435 family)